MLTEKQSHRLLEAIQRNALVYKILKDTVQLAEEENQELGNALMGMMNGNKKNENPNNRSG